MEETKKKKKFSWRWLLIIFFLLTGVISIFSDFGTGILSILIAVILLPQLSEFIMKKWNFVFSTKLQVLAVVILILLSATVFPNKNTSTTPTPQKDNTIKQEASNIPAPEETDQQKSTSPETATTTSPTPVQQPVIKNTPPVPSETISQKNAVKKAKSYLGYSAFSHDGLVAQLEYEQFSYVDAVYGADNSGANWNEQAAKQAKSYMEYSAFSRGSLIEQLRYEKFTQEQAEYGANAVGL